MVIQGGAVAPALRQVKSFLPPTITVLVSNDVYSPAIRKEAGDSVNGVYYWIHPAIYQNTDPVVQKWLGEMQKRLGFYHEIMARGITGMLVMKDAISRAGTTDGIAVMKQVHRSKNIPTPLGQYTYDPRDGEGLKSAVVLHAKGGADLSKDEVVFKATMDGELYKHRVRLPALFRRWIPGGALFVPWREVKTAGRRTEGAEHALAVRRLHFQATIGVAAPW